MTATIETDRFARQASLVPADKLADLSATVIGVGAIGRQVALQLASLGISQIQLIDFDIVEDTNVTTQGYLARHVGLPKVDATKQDCDAIDPTISVDAVFERFKPHYQLGEVVFCCVDSIAVRKAIWKSAGMRSQFWCDGRMLGETIRILTAADMESREKYPATLFESSEAQSGSCTAKGVIYTACIAAGLMLHQFTRWLRDIPVEPDLLLGLLASELNTEA